MSKKMIAVLLSILLMIMAVPVMAADSPVIFKSTVTVTEDGGRFQVGFVNIEFKKEFIQEDKLPETFNVTVYAENGVVYVEFEPGVKDFIKKVHIRAESYQGLLFDTFTGKNIEVKVKKQQLTAEHFSRYALR